MKTNSNSLMQGEIFALLSIFMLLIIGHNEVLQKRTQERVDSTIKDQVTPQSSYPPIIQIYSQDLSFKSGSALPEGNDKELKLKSYIEEIVVPQIENYLQKEDTKDVNMIEVIGHTDEISVRGNSNLDDKLLAYLDQDSENNSDETFKKLVEKFEDLELGSNADLGLVRALIVVKTLEFLQKTAKCDCEEIILFRAYSAAQLYAPQEDKNTPSEIDEDEESYRRRRRRIEVRFTTWIFD